MPDYQVGDVIYATRTLDDPASGDSPGCHLCSFGDKLIIREVTSLVKDRCKGYNVSHPRRTKKPFFTIYSNEMSRMKHFDHNHEPYKRFGY